VSLTSDLHTMMLDVVGAAERLCDAEPGQFAEAVAGLDEAVGRYRRTIAPPAGPFVNAGGRPTDETGKAGKRCGRCGKRPEKFPLVQNLGKIRERNWCLECCREYDREYKARRKRGA
jgi:hypothetical protein